jgi:hypothetical protein
MSKTMVMTVALAAAFAGGFAVRGFVPGEPVAYAQGNRVFELRTYTAADGKLEALHKRFREETVPKFFPRHGMTNIWYGKPLDAPQSQNTMAYIIAFPSREAAKKSWDSFRADQEWAKAAAASGVGQVQIQSIYFEPADYSPLK